MKVGYLNRHISLLTGSVLITIMIYTCYPLVQPQIVRQQSIKTKNGELHKDNRRSNLSQEQTPSYKRFQEFGSDDVNDFNPEDILDVSPKDRRPQPSMVPVTSNMESCLPIIKDLRVQLVSDYGE